MGPLTSASSQPSKLPVSAWACARRPSSTGITDVRGSSLALFNVTILDVGSRATTPWHFGHGAQRSPSRSENRLRLQKAQLHRTLSLLTKASTDARREAPLVVAGAESRCWQRPGWRLADHRWRGDRLLWGFRLARRARTSEVGSFLATIEAKDRSPVRATDLRESAASLAIPEPVLWLSRMPRRSKAGTAVSASAQPLTLSVRKASMGLGHIGCDLQRIETT